MGAETPHRLAKEGVQWKARDKGSTEHGRAGEGQRQRAGGGRGVVGGPLPDSPKEICAVVVRRHAFKGRKEAGQWP